MNRGFVSIKVDREERPDVDHLYMTACQLMTCGGGWPLTIIMTPGGRPFFAGTYYPKKSIPGRIGMMELLPRLEQLWKHERQKIDQTGEKMIQAINAASEPGPGSELDHSVAEEGFLELHNRFDKYHGGFGGAPKFPTPHNLTFLLRYWKRTGSKRALEMVEKTLSGIRQGGNIRPAGVRGAPLFN